jgi:hypothetical protein
VKKKRFPELVEETFIVLLMVTMGQYFYLLATVKHFAVKGTPDQFYLSLHGT